MQQVVDHLVLENVGEEAGVVLSKQGVDHALMYPYLLRMTVLVPWWIKVVVQVYVVSELIPFLLGSIE